ncbi:MAG: L,D-transpeptidase [Gemmatimonadaceae bacterium]
MIETESSDASAEKMPGDRRTGERPDASDRRRARWQDFRGAYPGILATMGIALLVMLAVDFWLVYKHVAYRNEIERLRSGMTDVEQRRTDVLLESTENRLAIMVELIRRQAQLDERLNLAIAVDSGVMYLQREGAELRRMRIAVGEEKTVGTPPDTVHLAAPLGERTVERVLDGDDAWEVPAWVYRDRGLAVPGDREIAGALGPAAVILNGGTVIYSMPESGPLNDSSYVLPGSVRVSEEDANAIAPNLAPGVKVYFY